MEEYIDPRFPDIDYLRKRAKKRIPGFAFDYFDGGCNAQINLKRNSDDIQATRLKPIYLKKEDAETGISMRLGAITFSNHGGRQLDNGESSLQSMKKIKNSYGDKITVMTDSGLRTGSDIACSLAEGAEMAFLGRSFMYGVAALGKQGGKQTLSILRKQLRQVLYQV